MCAESRKENIVVVPCVGIVAILPKAGPDGGALLLDHGPFIRNRLGRADIANELFHYTRVSVTVGA